MNNDQESQPDSHNETDPTATTSPNPATQPAPPEPLAPLAPPALAAPPVPLGQAPAASTEPLAPSAASSVPTETPAPTPSGSAAMASPVVQRSLALGRSIGRERALRAALSGAIVYGAAWVLAAVLSILALFAAGDSSPGASWAFEAPAQLVAMAVGGIFTIGATAVGVTANVSVVWLPLLLTALVAVGSVLLARRDEKARPSATAAMRWALAACAGLAVALLVVIVAAVLAVRFTSGDSADNEMLAMFSVSGSGSAASFTAFLGALVVGTLASYLGRAGIAPRAKTVTGVSPVRSAVAASIRATAVYTVVISVLLALTIVIYAISQGGIKILLTALLWLPTLVVDGLGLINLAPVSLTGSITSLMGATGAPTSFWLPGRLPVWATVLVLVVNLAVVVLAGIVLSLARRTAGVSVAARWVSTIASFAVLGVVVTLLGRVSLWTSVDTGGVGTELDSLLGGFGSSIVENIAAVNGAVSLSAGTFLVFAILGALVEAAATYIAPQLTPLLPASVTARLARVTGATAAPVLVGGIAGDGDDAVLAGAPATPVVVPMTPERKRRIRLVLIAVAAAVVVVAGAGITISAVNSTVFSPKKQVESYLGNIVDGNASAALDLAEISAPNASRVLLTDEVLSATEGGLTGYSITDVTVTNETAVVTAELDQDGEKTTVQYPVSRSGSKYVVFDDWNLNTVAIPALTVAVPDGTTELDVNGVTVAVDGINSDAGYLELPALPGTYVVGLAGDDEYLAAKPQTVTVAAGMDSYPATVSFELEPTEAFTASVQKQIEALLVSCAAEKLLQADDCPIYTYSYGDITDVVWTVNEQATFELSGYGGEEWSVMNEDEGKATVTYTQSTSYSEPEAVTDEVEFSVYGDVEMVDGAPVYTYGY
ncbi:MAG: hypothetical protein JWQ43_2866 [Glaciihabitans sp.]|nr:hypothetical protein [Glaciihabitans sp.]